MIDMGSNTLDVEVRPHRDRARTSTLDANVQASLPIEIIWQYPKSIFLYQGMNLIH